MDTYQTCPLCQQSNRCDVDNPAGCWCMYYQIPVELLALLPESSANPRCICAACIVSFIHHPAAFKAAIPGNPEAS